MAQESRVAVDVGGTFTDVVALRTQGGLRVEKVPTTSDSPSAGVLDAFRQAAADVPDVATFHHGTTLALNALLTRSGASTAIVATRGFRDVFLLGRTDRRAMYDIAYRKPAPLLERADTFEVTERVEFDGSVRTPLDEADVQRVAREITRGGYQAVAVAFLHAYANPDHERRVREILAAHVPGVEITLAHELSREYREYERTSTAVLDAYIKPVVRGYLGELDNRLVDNGFTGQFLMSRSGGGAMTGAAAREQPVNLILSGPAGGVVGAAGFARLTGRSNVITIDMGGTSLDASLVLNGEPVQHHGAQFEGLPINTPSLYIHTIGSGGGSVAHLDAAGALQVGPTSAGADPGPAAYGRGGVRPTVTDAALVTGYLGSDQPLGGTLSLDRTAAHRALEPVARQLELTSDELASGVLGIAETKIVGAVRAITVELGHDPHDFALLSFGGAGGFVAVDVARALGVGEVVVPPGQGAFSAQGMLMGDVQHDFARTSVTPLRELDPETLRAGYAEMLEQAHVTLADEGFAVQRRWFDYTVDARYSGQEHAVSVPYRVDSAAPVAAIAEEFTDLHQRRYGHVMTDPVEITTLRLRAVGAVDKPEFPHVSQRANGDPVSYGSRSARGSNGGQHEYALYARDDLRGGDTVAGPAIVTEHTATTVVHSEDRLDVGRYGELVITVAPTRFSGDRTNGGETDE